MNPRGFDRGSSGFDNVTPRRDESNNYYRDVHDADFYEYQRRRSPSPRRDDDRRMFNDKETSWDSQTGRNSSGWQDDRSRNRQARTPPNQRAGLLGAGPSDLAAGGQAGVGNQVLAAALQAQQTQAWLAALQANQMRLNNRENSSGGNFNNRNNQSRQQSNRQWNTRKRNSFPEPSGANKRNRRDDNRQANRFSGKDNQKRNQGRLSKDNKSNEYNPAEPTPDNFDNGKSAKDIILDELCEKIEELRKREKIERNISDQDVDKLVAFSFDGKVYKCDVCKVMCKGPQSLRTHLMAKKHNMTLISERGDGKDPCRDIMDIDLKPEDWLAKNDVARVLLEKQATSLDLARQEQRKREFEQNPANYVQYNVNSRKVAVKKEGSVSITTCAEVTVHVNEFSSDQHMFGCEFINAVVGFNCELCDTLISRESSVISHLQSVEHKEKYKKHVEQNDDYEETQVASNAKLDSVLSQNENKKVLLHESFDSDHFVYLRNDDSELIKSKSSIPNWSTMGSLPNSNQTGLPFIDDDDKCEENTSQETTDETQPTAEEAEGDGNATVEEGEIEEVKDDVQIDDAEPEESENFIEEEMESSQEPIVEKVVEKEETKELINRLPPRRAARGGSTAKRGKARGTPRAAKGKARSSIAAVVAESLDDSITTDDYEVIDEF